MTLSQLLDKYIAEQSDVKKDAERYIENSLLKELEYAKHKVLQIEQEIVDERRKITTAEENMRLLKIAKEEQ